MHDHCASVLSAKQRIVTNGNFIPNCCKTEYLGGPVYLKQRQIGGSQGDSLLFSKTFSKFL